MDSNSDKPGYKLDSDKPRFDLIPAEPMLELAKLYAMGAKKYADRNWEKGMDWSRVYRAVQTHLWQFWSGVDMDEETGLAHVTHAAFGCLALREYMSTHRELDNRPKQEGRFDSPDIME